MTIDALARPEIRDLHAYETAVPVSGTVRLNANEAPTCTARDSLNRYPENPPTELRSRLAEHYGVSPDNLLATRGSTEAIDLLIRAFCRAGRDNIVITPPTFVMYRAYADIQGAGTISYPLRPEQDFALDIDALISTCTEASKLIFVCSPNNPTGGIVPRSEVVRLLKAREKQSIVIVDEAYIEFSDSDSMADLVTEHDNLVVLRTLSKALALAGARCGAAICNSSLIRILARVLPPYAIATPVIDCVLRALSDYEAKGETQITETIAERERMTDLLASNDLVRKAWPSQANFLLVKFRDLETVQSRLRADNILIRDFGDDSELENCARVTIGNHDENNRLLAALRQPEDIRNVG